MAAISMRVLPPSSLRPHISRALSSPAGLQSSLAPFEHEPLTDPSTQFRLLQVEPAETSEAIYVSVQAFDRDNAPSYAALSYTWGAEKPTKQIVVNGKQLQVTGNCWYALGQLRLVSLYHYYWIDAICLNHDDLAEKNAQVGIMGSIYSQASCVHVSLGRHTKDTAILFQHVSVHGISPQDTETVSEISIEPWLRQMDDIQLQRLLSAFVAFGTAPYWSRLWAVQEFALPQKVLILCGNGCLEWSLIATLKAMLRKVLSTTPRKPPFLYTKGSLLEMPMTKVCDVRRTVQHTGSKVAGFIDILLNSLNRECTDPRDSIYGYLSFVDWEDEQVPLVPDYSLSTTQLALKVLQYSDTSNTVRAVCRLIKLLRLEANNPDMSALSQARTLPAISQANEAKRSRRVLSASFIRCGSFETITGEEQRNSVSEDWDSIRFERMPRVPRKFTSAGNRLSVEVSVLVPSETRPGDIILQLNKVSGPAASLFQLHLDAHTGMPQFFDRAGLILRRLDDGTYDTIGHAVFASESPPLSHLTPVVESNLEFDLHLGLEDLLVWAWQLRDQTCVDVNGTKYDRDPSRLPVRYCSAPQSSYATARQVSNKPLLHGTAGAAQTSSAMMHRLSLGQR